MVMGCTCRRQVLNMAGPEFVQGALCQAVCIPRVLLRCAALREVC